MLAAKDKAQLIDALPLNVEQLIELQPLSMVPTAITEAQLTELQPLGMMPAANTEAQLIELLVELSTAVPEGVPPRRR